MELNILLQHVWFGETSDPELSDPIYEAGNVVFGESIGDLFCLIIAIFNFIK